MKNQEITKYKEMILKMTLVFLDKWKKRLSFVFDFSYTLL